MEARRAHDAVLDDGEVEVGALADRSVGVHEDALVKAGLLRLHEVHGVLQIVDALELREGAALVGDGRRLDPPALGYVRLGVGAVVEDAVQLRTERVCPRQPKAPPPR